MEWSFGAKIHTFGVENGKLLSYGILLVSIKHEFWRENSNFCSRKRKSFESWNINSTITTRILARKFKLFYLKYITKMIKILKFLSNFCYEVELYLGSIF